MKTTHLILSAGLLLAAAPLLSGQPDFVENFNSFDGVNQTDTSSPADTGGQYFAFPTGPTSTSAGFQKDTNSFRGPGLRFLGSEEKALVCNQEFDIVGNNRHMVAFVVQFSEATSTSGNADFVEVFSAVPDDASLSAPAFIQYLVAVGKLGGTTQQSIFLIAPDASPNEFHLYEVPATPDQWHLVVVMYDPATTTSSSDVALRMWVDPSSPTDDPDVVVTRVSNQLSSRFGNGPITRFVFGNSTNTGIVRRGVGADRSGTSSVKVDRVGGWQGYSETRGLGDLTDALTFLTDFSEVADWEMYE